MQDGPDIASAEGIKASYYKTLAQALENKLGALAQIAALLANIMTADIRAGTLSFL